MLTDDQVAQFKLFGFVTLRNILTSEELEALRTEFNHAATRNECQVGQFDGVQAQTFSMLGEDTPFYSSLLEDPRFYQPAVELFGEDVLALEINSYRYVSNTPWHFNDGAPNIHGYGPKYQFPVFESVTADTGALRFIPGSHKNPWQSELTGWWPLAKGSARGDKGMEFLDKVPCFVAECRPGDAVLFDMRLLHATWGGKTDRRISCVTYYHYPETVEEMEVMRTTAQSFYHNSDRWNKTQWEEWFSNPHDSPLRQSWIDAWERLATTPQSATGLRLVHDDHETATFEQVST